MRIRRALMLLGSIALGAMLIWLLIRLGKVNVAVTWRQLEEASPVDFLKLAALNALMVWLSAVKWRSVDAVLRRDDDAVPSRTSAFAMSSVGMALGLVLPVQLGMTAARTVGTRVYGRMLKRGTGGTLFEQSFDLLAVVLLGAASTVTWFCRGGAGIWAICVASAVATGLGGMRPALWVLRRALKWMSERANLRLGSWVLRRQDSFLASVLQGLCEVEGSGLVKAGLARRLLALSVARFGVVVLMAKQTAEMAGAHIALWQMGAAIPFATLANLIAVTPGGIGLTELTSVTALHLFGAPLGMTSQWALANRILGTGSSFAVAACALLFLGVKRLAASGENALNAAGQESVQGDLSVGRERS